MPSTAEHDSTTITFRVDRATRRVISAVAYADLVAKTGTTARPGDVIVSEFVRDVLDEVIDHYASEAGGIRALLEELQAAEVKELEAQLEDVKSLRSLDERLAHLPANRRTRKQQSAKSS